ncbi:MAG: sensor histidine kinase [Saprospiraceae bacterium]
MAKYSYRRKLLLYYLSVFTIFLLISISFQYLREKRFQVEKLETTLDNIAEITGKYIKNNNIQRSRQYQFIDSLKSIIPLADTRITVISKEGKVLYDSFIKDYQKLENHSNRPELITAGKDTKGASIRQSSSTGKTYYYYAKKMDNYYIRTAVIYNMTVITFLKANQDFFYFSFFLFLAILCLLWFVTNQFTLSISKLQEFAINASTQKNIDTNISFPTNEIGVIGKQILRIYDNLQETQLELSKEKERLFRHLYIINEGVAIFSSDKKKLLSNQHFMNYINVIAEKSIDGDFDIFKLKDFKEINAFLAPYLYLDQKLPKSNELEKQIKIQQDQKYFLIKCIIFYDKSFEIIITDITKREKNKIIKEQMTSNIAHELKTPISAIQAFLETVLANPKIEAEKKIYFIQKAFYQTERLNRLIQDITTINKLETEVDFFEKKRVSLYDIIMEIRETTELRMEARKMELSCNFPMDITIMGNKEFVYSIFQNLVENSINYAGIGTKIKISKYHEDKNFYYFSYFDDGMGIPEEHLNRIFERFYRVDSGRSRKQGGTGLGLSIVKNAVLFHKGEISAKSRKKGGVEFLFSLRKR